MKVDENDAFSSVYQEFFEWFNSGANPAQASAFVLETLEENFEDEEESVPSWYGLALAQWETKSLDPQLLAKVVSFLESGADRKLMRDLGANPDQLAEREAHLRAFIDKISVPRATSARRVRKKIDVREVVLAELVSPDGNKTFTVAETWVDGGYQHTTGTIMWPDGGGSVFNFVLADATVTARWETSELLEVSIADEVTFQKQDFSAFFDGETVTIEYL